MCRNFTALPVMCKLFEGDTFVEVLFYFVEKRMNFYIC